MKLTKLVYLSLLAFCILGFSGHLAAQQNMFSKRMKLRDMYFSVQEYSSGVLQISVNLTGEPIVRDHQLEGRRVIDAEVADLNGDGSPELFVYLSSRGQAYGDVIAYSVAGGSSMYEVYFPGVRSNSEANRGYMGQDEFRVVENTLVQRFPVYRGGRSTGEMREVQWVMAPGENSPVLRVDRVSEYRGNPSGQYNNQGRNRSGLVENLSLQGIDFNIDAPGNGYLTIRTNGLRGNDEMMEHQIGAKTVTGTEVADLNGDGSPELFVYLSSGSQGYGEVIAYSVLNKRAMVQIYYPGVRNNSRASRGYMGHDEFRVVENILVQRFPLYRNGRRTGETREVQWSMAPGENSPVFRVDRVSEY